MATKIKIVLVSAVVAAVAAVATPLASAGDWSNTKLDVAATQLAGHGVNVWCESSWSDWVHTGDSVYEDWDGLLGFTLQNTSTIYLNPTVCWTLQELLAGDDVGTFNAAEALLTLTHESMHQRGYWDESAAECAALPLVTGVAANNFGVPNLVTVPYTATVSKRVVVRVAGRTVVRTVKTQVVRHKHVVNPWLVRMASDVQWWHKTAPDAYHEGSCG